MKGRFLPAKKLAENTNWLKSLRQSSQAYVTPGGCGFIPKPALPAVDALDSLPLRPWLPAELEIFP